MFSSCPQNKCCGAANDASLGCSTSVSLGAGMGAGTCGPRLYGGLCCCGSPADPRVCHGAPQGARGHSLSHPQGSVCTENPIGGLYLEHILPAKERSNQTLRNAAQRNPKGPNRKVLGGTWQVRENLGNADPSGTLRPTDPTEGALNTCSITHTVSVCAPCLGLLVALASCPHSNTWPVADG